MLYVLVILISILCLLLCVGLAKLIDLSNKNKDWYIAIQKRIEEEN